jgi:hypothetical protein
MTENESVRSAHEEQDRAALEDLARPGSVANPRRTRR